MINKFLTELETILKDKNIESDNIINTYKDLFNEYVHLGQSEFDIICHFGEPSEIVAEYEKTGTLAVPDMERHISFHVPTYLAPKIEVVTETAEKEREESTLPTTKAGLICNDIFFVGIGMLIAIAGVIALGGVSIFMTAGSIAQMGAVWELATEGARIGGFMLALLFLIISIVFYVLIVWIVKIVIQFMKKYVQDHKVAWAKIMEAEKAKVVDNDNNEDNMN